MKGYEGLFILKANLSKDEIEKASSSIADGIAKNGGVVANIEDLGMRQLAYEIKREKQGHYILMNFTAESKAILNLEKSYKLNESILRALIFKRNEK